MGCGKSKAKQVRQQDVAEADARREEERKQKLVKAEEDARRRAAEEEAEESERRRREEEEEARRLQKEREEEEEREAQRIADEEEAAQEKRRQEEAAALEREKAAERERARQEQDRLRQEQFIKAPSSVKGVEPEESSDEKNDDEKLTDELPSEPEEAKKTKQAPPKKSLKDFPAPGACDSCTLDIDLLKEMETAPCSPRRSPLGNRIGEIAAKCGCEIDPEHMSCDCNICRNLDLTDAPLLA